MSETFHHDQTAKLVRMANQIGDFFESQPEAHRVSGIADHIAQFWDKTMRRDIYAHVAAGGAGLHAPVLDAIRQVQAEDRALSELKR